MSFYDINTTNEIIDFFIHLFSTKHWPARWNCGYWSNFHGWLYILSDFTIWLAYFIIPVIMTLSLRNIKNLKFHRLFLFFAAFILFCGVTHLLDAIIFWWPTYRLSALIRFFTAIISVATVLTLIKDLPEILGLALTKVNDSQTNELNILKKKLNQKEEKIEQMRKEIEKLLDKS